MVTLPEAVMLRHCPADVERFVMAREVEVALVKSAEVEKSAVVVAFVATSDVEKRLVEVALVMMALVAPSDVVVAFVNKKLVPLIAVVEAYGNCEAATVDDEKKTPCVRVVEPVVVGEAKREIGANGVVVPIPRKPLLVIVVVLVLPKLAVPAESIDEKSVVVVAFAATRLAKEEVDDALMPLEKFRYVEVALFGKR